MIYQILGQFGGGTSEQPSVTSPTPQLSGDAKASLTTITWNNTGADSYVWQIADDVEFSNPTQASGTDLSEAYVGLLPNSQYYFRVRALLNGVYSAWNTINFYVNELIVISVSNLAASVDSEQSVLTWINPSAGFSTLTVERSTDGSNYTTLNAAVSGTTYTATGLTNSTLYYFRVTPNVNDVDYTATQTVTNVTPQPTPQLNAPTDLTFNELGSGNVEITTTYTGEAGVTYVIERDTIQVSSTTSNPATVSGFVGGNIYSMRVKVQKAGFTDSDWYMEAYNYTPIEIFDDLTEFGITDGYTTYFNGELTVTPLGNSTSRITRSGGAAFNANFVGRIFESFRIHKNPADYPATGDNYIPKATTVRYATVTTFESESSIIVDFEYNGGNDITPTATIGTGGTFFVDNRAAFEGWVNSATRNTEGRFNGVIAMKGLPNCTVTKDLAIKDSAGTYSGIRLKFFWSDGFNVGERGTDGNSTWATSFGASNVFNFGNGLINIDLPQILPTFYASPSVQYINKNVNLFYDTASTASTATGVKKTYNWDMYEERDAMPPSLASTMQFLLPNLGYCVGGGTHDGTDITAFNTYAIEGGWTSIDPMNFKAKFKSGILFHIYGTPEKRADFIEKESLKPVTYSANGIRWNNNREIEISDSILTWYSLCNQYWLGSTYGNYKKFVYVDVELNGKVFRIYLKNYGSWIMEHGSLTDPPTVLLDGARALAFDRIPNTDDVITLGAGTAQCPAVTADGKVNLFGWSAQVGTVLNINGTNYTVQAVADKFEKVPFWSGGFYNWWECTLNAPAPAEATTATVVSSPISDLLDGNYRVPIKVAVDNDSFGHMCYTDQETNMRWEYVNFNGYVRATGEYDNSENLYRMTQIAEFTECYLVDENGNPAYAQGTEYNPTSLKRRENLTSNPNHRIKISGGRLYRSRTNAAQANVVFTNKPELVYGTTSFGEPRLYNPIMGDNLGLIVGNRGVSIVLDGQNIDISNTEMFGNFLLAGNGTATINNIITYLVPNQTYYSALIIGNQPSGQPSVVNNMVILGDSGECGINVTGTYPLGTLNITLTNWTLRPAAFLGDGFNYGSFTPAEYAPYITINGTTPT